MTNIVLPIPQIFERAFGIRPKVSTAQERGKLPQGAVVDGQFTPVSVSGFGNIPQSATETRWAQVQFLAGNYKTTTGALAAMPDIFLPAATLVEVSRTKTLVITSKVVEFIDLDLFQVSIKGVITPGSMRGAIEGSHLDYPYNDVKLLDQLFEVCDAINVSGDIFAEKGITRLVIESYDLPRVEGFPNVQPFSLRCRSDEAVELVLKNTPKLSVNL